jgi:hypothetical protein
MLQAVLPTSCEAMKFSVKVVRVVEAFAEAISQVES